MTTHPTHSTYPMYFTGQPGTVAPVLPPPEPLPYHRLAHTTRRHRWWRPLLGSGVVLAGALVVMLGLIAGSEVAGYLLRRPVDSEGLRTWGDIGDTALGLLSIALMTPAVLLAAYWVQRRPAGTLSSVTGRLRWAWLGLCLAVAGPLVAVAMGVSFLLPESAGGGAAGLEWAGLSSFLLGLAMVCALVPFQAAAEEYVFRGWLVQAVGAWCRSPWVAVLPQALLFAAAHGWGTAWGFADLVVFGLVAGWLTIRTGGLEAAIALHVLNNLLAFGVASAIAGALASEETAVDMGWMAVAIDVPMVLLYAAAVLWLARRRRPAALSQADR
ncbi:type II CAAX endopeptidase family protein [Streptomyces sp. NPDC049837]|uniref:CPBP family intramembrane glutamic endopeptidase n=1 Tax=Streptomyces sp. NPDC049837 TaxID=3155277 RepID=UPI003421EE71